MKKLIILDYTTSQAHCYSYDPIKHPDYKLDELVKTLGHNINSCTYMTTNEEIIIH